MVFILTDGLIRILTFGFVATKISLGIARAQALKVFKKRA